MAGPVESLSRQLQQALVPCFEPDNLYLTTDRLEAILTAGAIGDVLRQALPDHSEGARKALVSRILASYSTKAERSSEKGQPLGRLFSLLIYVGNPDKILLFVQAGLSDEDLPLPLPSLNQGHYGWIWYRWEPECRHAFFKSQHSFVPSFLSKSTHVAQNIAPALRVLPMSPLSSAQQCLAVGEMGDYRGPISLFEAHNNLSETPHEKFTIYTLFYAPDKPSFSELQHTFKYIEKLKLSTSIEHIFMPLSSYDYLGHRRFIAPNFQPYIHAPAFADPHCYENILWFARQWEEVASDLYNLMGTRIPSMKRPFGQGDIWLKPEALRLVQDKHYPDVPTLKVDVTFCKLEHYHVCRRWPEPTCIDGVAPPHEQRLRRYIPPEFFDCGIGLSDDATRTTWTIGCLLLESATKIITGHTLEIALARRGLPFLYHGFYEVNGEGGLCFGIVQALDELPQHPNCTPFLRDLLRLVRDHCLVFAYDERLEMNDLLTELRKLRDKVEGSRNYALGRYTKARKEDRIQPIWPGKPTLDKLSTTSSAQRRSWASRGKTRSEPVMAAPKMVGLIGRVASLRAVFDSKR